MPSSSITVNGKSFNLVRYFFALSFLLMGITTLSMTVYLHHYSANQLLEMEKGRAASMAQVFENSLWDQFRPLTQPGHSTATLKANAQDPELIRAVKKLMRDTEVIKLKVYSLSGQIVFSTDNRDIGKSSEDNEGFLSAASNRPVSELDESHTFDAFEKQLVDRDVTSTYVPVHDQQGKVDGVLELYIDETDFIRETNRQLNWLGASILMVMGVLFICQLLVVRRAGRIIREQAAALAMANRELDDRVAARTAELENEIEIRLQTEEQLERLAHHDPLTLLPNRLMFHKQLGELLHPGNSPHHQPLAILFIDLDRFKDVNDTLGHYVGDLLLVAVAQRLLSLKRPQDMLARLGGDEFVYIVNGYPSTDTVAHLANKLVALFQSSYRIHDNDLFLSASIGISHYPKDGQDRDTLIRHADIAMYHAKATGRNRAEAYNEEMSVAAEARVNIERGLRIALEHDEIRVHFQPKVNANTGELIGAEALARWTSAQLGEISPAKFIPVAEETGLIIPLGDLVLEKTCQQMAAWRAAGFNLPCVSVNLSAKQLERQDFTQRLSELLHTYQLPAAAIELEITESVIMSIENAVQSLDALRQLGVGLSIDDFGTGYSSLAYLKQLPVHILKIDRSFVQDIGTRKDSEAIIRTIVALANSLGLATVAEGVEESEQVEFLSREGCHTIQGYYFGRPQTAEDLFNTWHQH